jgi:hypothetical protein
MCAMENEKQVFSCFVKALPEFPDEPILEWDVVEEWYTTRKLPRPPAPFDSRPDVICLTKSRKLIGV